MLTNKFLQKSLEMPAIMDSAWFEKCVNHLNDAILITEAEPFDLPGPRILWANDVFYKNTGYEPSEIIGQSPRILQGPLTDKLVLKKLRTALEKAEICRVEVLNYKKDGSTFWNEFEVTPVANEVGYFTHWIAVQRDITERKLAEEITTKAYGLLKTAEKLTHIGSWEWDIEEDKFTMSDEWLQIHGITNRNITMHELITMAHPDDAKAIEKNFQDALDGVRSYDITHRIIRQDNRQERIVLAKGIVSFDKQGMPYRVQGTAQDITSIKQAEVDLIHSHAFSDAIVNSVVEAVISIDHNGLIKSFNDAAQKMFGYTFDEIKDKNVKILMPYQYSSHHDQYLAQYLKTNTTHIIGTGRELEAHRKDGVTFPIHLSVSEIYHHKSRMFVGLIRDITQQRASEDEAILHIEQLAHADRLNALGEMAAGIAHEINQPLTAISLYSQTARNFCENGKFEKLPELFEKISQQSRRAGAVLERVQIMTRQGDNSKDVVDCNILIDEVKKLAESEARLRDISIKIINCNVQTNVFVDRVQIQQVILNLLRNGMEAMQTIACKNGAVIDLQFKINAENYVEISVVDSGCGLPKQMIDKLFTPFSSTKRNGTGIGLSISKSIIEQHGGHIHFSKNKPAGSIFYFTLPVHKEEISHDK